MPNPRQHSWISHEGGESIPREEINVVSPGTAEEWPEPEITAGDSITVTGLDSGDTVRIVWESPEGDATAVLATYKVP